MNVKVYVVTPPWHKWADIVIWTLVYVSLFAYGLSQIAYPPSSVVGHTGALLLQFSGGLVSVMSIAALIGVISRKVVWEASVCWFIVAGMIVYPTAVWALVVNEGAERLTPGALLLTVGVLLFTGRTLRLITERKNEVGLMIAEHEALDGIKTIQGKQ